MRVLEINGNKIVIKLSHFFGMEKILFNGEIVSQKKTFWGGLHSFQVKENGTDTQYEIKIGISFPIGARIVISRNGEILYNDNDIENARCGQS